MPFSPLALVVDDDENIREALTELAQREGFRATGAGSLAEARLRLKESRPDVVMTDLGLPDGNGLDLLADLPEPPRPEIILITGNATVDSAIAAIRTGVLDYLEKPVDTRRLKSVLANVSRTLQLKQENQALRFELRKLGRFEGMIGVSTAMQKVYDLIARVAPTQASVLITGDSGTGKEMVAQTVHQLSTRRNGPFLPVNCSAVPATLIESQLFGHEKGSFTGAAQQHRGFFERASGGSLFLDEITEMPMELQARLLRVLETGTVMRIGSETQIQVDVRLIAATNRSPEAAVRDGKLREDLYYRLNVFPVNLPPLRDRGEDVELLADYFLSQLNQEAGTTKVLSDRSRDRLRRHSWPGNVRELKNAMHRAFIMAEDQVELEIPAGAMAGSHDAAGGGGSSSGLDSIEVGLALDEVERRVILATLERYEGDKRRAAETLGISLKTLYNRLNVYAASGNGPQQPV